MMEFEEYEKVQHLWPREQLYLYAYNEGDTPQDLIISFSAATTLSSTFLTAILSLLLFMH